MSEDDSIKCVYSHNDASLLFDGDRFISITSSNYLTDSEATRLLESLVRDHVSYLRSHSFSEVPCE